MLTRANIHYSLYLLGLLVLIAAIPLSHFLMGLCAFILLLNWIVEWNWCEKWERAKQNKAIFWISGLYIVSLLGLIRTEDFHIAGSVLLAQLPILLGPVIIATSQPLTAHNKQRLIDLFCLATFSGCIASVIYWRTHTIGDLREISICIDHIRFSLCIVLAIVFCLHSMFNGFWKHSRQRFVYAVIAMLMFLYLFIAQTLTGIISLFVVIVAFWAYMLIKWENRRLKVVLSVVMSAGIFAVSLYFGQLTYRYFHNQDTTIETRLTALGNPYSFDDNSLVENGHKLGYYVCESELQSAWTLRSDTTYTDLLQQTLIRYLNSKGLRKDYAAVMSLSDKDIWNVEHLEANYEYTRSFGIKRALFSTFFSFSLYQHYGYIDNSSMLQRVELWNASSKVLRQNWLLGVGIGDYKAALDDQLAAQGSPIAHKQNRGSHNQFLTFGLMGGVLLMLYFIWIMFYPFVAFRSRINFVYIAFFLVLFLSMFTEDTIMSQTGRMLFAILTPIQLLGEKW